MATNLILSKESSESEIKRYFNAVLELSKSDNEFPINLDEVWMLVYPRKDHAVRELIDGGQFIEGVDYQVSPKMGKTPKAADRQMSTNLQFPAWSSSSREKSVLCLRFIVKCSTKASGK